MSAFPEGFFRMVSGDRKILCYHCSTCGCSYRDISGQAIWCCGAKKTFEGSGGLREVRIEAPQSAAVDLSIPTRVGNSILQIV
jgi:hypothetical protein